MIQLQVRDAYVRIDWEDANLKVTIFPKDNPENSVELTEHQIENIQRAIRQVRSEKWILSKTTGT